MARRRIDEQLVVLARSVDATAPETHCEAWVALRGRGPLLWRPRRRHLVVRAGDEVLLVRWRRRRHLDANDVVARFPVRPGTLRRQRRLGLLRQLVVADPDGGAPHVIEFPVRARRFAAALADALR